MIGTLQLSLQSALQWISHYFPMISLPHYDKFYHELHLSPDRLNP